MRKTCIVAGIGQRPHWNSVCTGRASGSDREKAGRARCTVVVDILSFETFFGLKFSFDLKLCCFCVPHVFVSTAVLTLVVGVVHLLHHGQHQVSAHVRVVQPMERDLTALFALSEDGKERGPRVRPEILENIIEKQKILLKQFLGLICFFCRGPEETKC